LEGSDARSCAQWNVAPKRTRSPAKPDPRSPKGQGGNAQIKNNSLTYMNAKNSNINKSINNQIFCGILANAANFLIKYSVQT